MLALLVVLLILRRQRPERYGRLLIAWGLIVLGSAVLFLIPRMVSSALEGIFYHLPPRCWPESSIYSARGNYEWGPFQFLWFFNLIPRMFSILAVV